MAEDLEFATRITGVDNAVAEVGRIKSANEQTARSTTQAAQQTRIAAQQTQQSVAQLGEGMRQMGQRTGQTVSALGQFANTMSALAPAGSQAAQIITQLGGTISALSSSALGPVGIALAAVSSAVGVYRIATQDASRETDTMAESLAHVAQSARTAAEQISDLQRVVNNRDAEERLGRIARGEVSTAEDARLGAERLRRLAEEGRRRGGTAAEVFGAVPTPGLEDSFVSAEDEAARLAARGQQLASQEAQGRGSRSGGSGGTSALEENQRGYYERLEAMRQQNIATEAQHAEEQRAIDQLTIDSKRAVEEAEADARTRREEATKAELAYQLEAQRALAEDAMSAANDFEGAWRNGIDGVVDAWVDANKSLRAAGQQMISTSRLLEQGMTSVGHNIADTIGGTMTSAFQSALGAWLDGSKSFVEAAEDMAKGIIKALVMESIVQAITEGARGIADLASYRYDSAALHFAAAAAWAGVGVVAGGVGAAVGAFGGGASKESSASASTQVTPTETQAAAPTNTVINVYPGGFLTTREVQAGIVQALNDAGRDGRRLDPALVGL